MDRSLFPKKDIYTVGELSSLISQVMQSELFMNIKVRGEIVSKQIKNGNVYLTLIDSDQEQTSPKGKATLKVIVFSWYDKYIQEEYKEGDEVIVGGDMSYYGPFGSLSLNAKNLCLYGEGMELVKLRRLKEKLEKEGLFDPNRKRKLPESIHKIAIVTSASGAAYHDILETLGKKFPVSTVLFDAVVQGQEAPSSLIRALDRAYKSDCDILIFGRGGGSKTDLACFNDEAVVRKLAASPIPTITGIGHEIDTSLCDLAADIYAITPTDAANKALPDLEQVISNLAQQQAALTEAAASYLAGEELFLSRAGQVLQEHSPVSYFNQALLKLEAVKDNLDATFLRLVGVREIATEKALNALEQAYPLKSLKSGTALIKMGGKPVTSIKEVQSGDEVELGLTDGVVLATIK